MTDRLPGRLSYVQLRRYARRVTALLDDPRVVDDLLLVGLWLARAVFLDIPARVPAEDGQGTGWSWETIAGDLFAARSTNRNHVLRLQKAIADDIPRYDPRVDRESGAVPGWAYRGCGASMIRRSGPCGQTARMSGFLLDPATGRHRQIRACPRHESWYDLQLLENRQDVEAARAAGRLIEPAQNAGGVLRGHLPGLNWDQMYAWLHPGWTPPPTPGHRPPGRPELTVFVTPTPAPADQTGPFEKVRLQGLPGGVLVVPRGFPDGAA